MPRRADDDRNLLQQLGVRGIAAIVLIIVAVIFLAENGRNTKIRFVGPEVSAPLWLALLIAVLLGALAGGLAMWRRDRHR